ncbi:MAG: hypothetical protein KDM91_21255 [Verrucomicrobiae bacterium]|nr:hypothetical protein [Verrucomicrobiae bacterium]MCP5541972.1 hypothetical protein [Akkermansiaceae bacterium]
MNRHEFVRLSTGLLGGLGLRGAFADSVQGAENTPSAASAPVLDESYLAKGLTGMARSDGWFPAHLGAAVLSGYYLCRENKLGADVVAAIKSQIDNLIEIVTPAQFEPLPEETPDEALIEKIPAALAPAVEGGLRAHGHAVIYTALALRALRDAPHLAQPTLIGKLCGHTAQIAKKKPQKPATPGPYSDSQAMVESLFDNMARFEPLLGRPKVTRPNFTHMTTHSDALLTLDELGYTDLSRAGHPGHRAHVGEPVPEFDPAQHPIEESHPSLESIVSEEFWESEENRRLWNRMWDFDTNPNGYWIAFGHLFKMLYAYHRLVPRIADKEKVRLCSRVLLERYFNPNVLGG